MQLLNCFYQHYLFSDLNGSSFQFQFSCLFPSKLDIFKLSVRLEMLHKLDNFYNWLVVFTVYQKNINTKLFDRHDTPLFINWSIENHKQTTIPNLTEFGISTRWPNPYRAPFTYNNISESCVCADTGWTRTKCLVSKLTKSWGDCSDDQHGDDRQYNGNIGQVIPTSNSMSVHVDS